MQYGQSRGKIWTEEEDSYLVNMMNRFGYGNWERMRMQIRHAWQFKLDWFFKVRPRANRVGKCAIRTRHTPAAACSLATRPSCSGAAIF